MTYFLHIFPPYVRRRTFSINWTFCIFSLYFHDFSISRTKKKWLVPNRWHGRVIKVYQRQPRVSRVEKVEKVVAVALAVVEVEAVAVAVALVAVTEIETQKETFRVDVSVNNWKIDLLLQPLSGKNHMCGLSRK